MKGIKKYLKKRKKGIDVLLKNTEKTNTNDFYHKLRLEIKKLNAFLHLLEFCAQNFDRKKTFKPFKIIFSQAGKIRELKIEEEMLNEYLNHQDLLAYRNKLQKKERKHQLFFFETVNKSLILKQKKAINEIKPFLKKIDIKKVNTYLTRNRSRIIKIIHKSDLHLSELHDLRKQLKLYYYLQKNFDLRNQNELISNHKILLDLIGEWHDSQMILDHLKKKIKIMETNTQETAPLENIKTKIASENRRVFDKLKIAISNSQN